MAEYAGFDAALVCRFGHVINKAVGRYPHRVEKRCQRCSEVVVSACASCNTPIRGAELERIGSELFLADYEAKYLPPVYCQECGEPFPWTQEILRFAEDQARNLTADELAEYRKSLEMLAAGHPAAAGAAGVVRRAMDRMSVEGVEMLRAVLANIVSDVLMGQVFKGR